MIKISFLFFLLSLIASADININIESDSFDSTIEYDATQKLITIKNPGNYILAGLSDKTFKIMSSATLNFNLLEIHSKGKNPPLIIGSKCDVKIHLITTNVLMDSDQNEKNGIIVMESGSKLTFSAEEDEDSYVILTVFKNMAIYGEESTELIMKNGYIMINANPGSNVGGISIRGNIIINNGIISDDINPEKYPSIKAGDSIIIKKGSILVHMIEAGKNINLGEITQNPHSEDDDEDPEFGIFIETLNEGIKADSITINSGLIEIFSNKDSISSNKDITINGGNLLIFAGNSETESQPFKTNGKTKISNSMIQALGTKCPESEISTQQVSIAYSGNLKKDQKVEIYLQGESILELDEREYNYNYFFASIYKFPGQTKLQIKIDGKEVSSLSGYSCGSGGSTTDEGESSGAKRLDYSFFLVLLILL